MPKKTTSGAPRSKSFRMPREHEVEMYLRNLSNEKAHRLFRSAGHGRFDEQRTEEALEREIDRRVREFLHSAKGRDAITQRQEEEIQRRVAARLETREAQQAQEKALTAALSRQVRDQGTEFDQLCRQAVEQEVQRWLESSKRKGAFQSLLEQALDVNICKSAAAHRRPWITMRLAELKGHSDDV